MSDHPDNHNNPHPPADRLDAYLLDELSTAEYAAVDEHLASCADCRAQVTELRRTLAAYTSATLPPAPQAVLDELLAGQRQPRGSGRGIASIWRPASLLAASVSAIGIFLGGFWLGQQQTLPAVQVAIEDTLAVIRPLATPPAVTFTPTAADYLRGLAPSDTVRH
jgi:anti-sigma factor RsiW